MPSAQTRQPTFSVALPSHWLKLTPGTVDQTFRCEPRKSIAGWPSGFAMLSPPNSSVG